MQIDLMAPRVVDTPFMQRLQNGEQCARRLRQTVFDAFRHFVLQRPAVDEAIRFHLPLMQSTATSMLQK